MLRSLTLRSILLFMFALCLQNVAAQRTEDCEIDIAFVVDSSISLGREYWGLMLFFIREFSEEIRITSDGVNMGVITFSDSATIEIPLGEHDDTPSFQEDVSRIRVVNHQTNIADGLRLAREEFYEPRGGIRRGGRSIVVVIGDGIATIEANGMRDEADLLRAEGASVFVLGVGRKLDLQELAFIANDPDEEYLFMYSRYRTLILQVKEYIAELCGSDLPPTTTPRVTTEPTTTQPPTTQPPTTQPPTTQPPTTQPPTTQPPTTQPPTSLRTTQTQRPTTRETTYEPSTTQPPTTRETTQEPGPNVRCRKFDIAFMLDKSGSIDSDHFTVMKRHVVDFIEYLDIGRNENQVGLVTFSTEAFFDIPLDKHQDKRELQREVLSIQFQDQMTNISGAIRTTYNELFQEEQGDRADAEDIAILFTDGRSNRETHLTAKEAARMRHLGITVFVISIGNETNQLELATVASRPQYYYLKQYLSGDDYVRDEQSVFNSVCSENKPIQHLPDSNPESCVSDILLILDDSLMDDSEWEAVIAAMQNFVRHLVIGFNSQLVSVATVGGGPQVHIALTQYTDADDLIEAIGEIQPSRQLGDPAQAVLMSQNLLPERTDPEAIGQSGATGDRIWASNHAVLVTSQIDYRYIHRLRYTIDYVARSGIDVFVVLVDQFGFGSHDDPDMSNNGIITIPGFSLLVDNTQILAKAVCNTAPVVWNCDFEDQDLCEMTQSSGDHFDWTMTRGETISDNTGPSHAAEGQYYMYIESSDPRVRHDTADLIYPARRDGEYCLMFMYHMLGRHTGSLIVAQRRRRTAATGDIHWALHGPQGSQWTQGAVTLNLDYNDEIVIKGVRGTAHTGDISIDSLQLLDGVCAPQYTGQWFIIEDEDSKR